jgi:hypothetical protein
MNKKILIITPHYPPSNLASVHRSRLFAQHLPAFGWEPIILTVHEDYYEEELDRNLEQILPEWQRIEKVKAFRLTKPRLIGDIGLRGFFQLRKKALQLVILEKIDFVYIPIPSFYASLIGPYLHRKTGVKYGIDYIDPWVHIFPGSDKIFSRHWFSTVLAKFLEPIAVRHASIITGVAEGYYKGVQERNPDLLKNCLFGAMPYGGEETDHSTVKRLALKPYLFQKNEKIQIVYAGAMLPKAHELVEQIFKSMAEYTSVFENVEFHFIGTGKSPNDPHGYNIRPLAEKYGLWKKVVFEYPQRIPYLAVLAHLEAADGVFILGSTEAHYTPSKIYQSVLSGKPILAILHKYSSGVDILRNSGAGIVIDFNGDVELSIIDQKWILNWRQFICFALNYKPKEVKKTGFEMFSSYSVTAQLNSLLQKIF